MIKVHKFQDKNQWSYGLLCDTSIMFFHNSFLYSHLISRVRFHMAERTSKQQSINLRRIGNWTRIGFGKYLGRIHLHSNEKQKIWPKSQFQMFGFKSVYGSSYIAYFIFPSFPVYTMLFSILSISSSTFFEVCLVAFNPCLSGNKLSGRILRWINAIIGLLY